MTGLPRVAIAGATGNLGPAILKGLLDGGFHVTVLTRESTTSKIPDHPNQVVKRVDYTSQASLVPALTGVDVVVATLGLTTGADTGKPLVEAAAAAGVTRFLPSEFGADVALPANAKLAVFKAKAEMRQYVEEVATKYPDFSYTYLVVGPFLDWCLQRGVFGNLELRTATLYNGGDVPFSTSRLSTVAQGVVSTLTHLDETKNQVVRMHDGVTTQNKILAAIKKIDGREWTTDDKSTKDVEQWAIQEMSTPGGNVTAAIFGLLAVSIYGGTEYASDLSGTTWNERLGIKELTSGEIDQVVVDTVKAL